MISDFSDGVSGSYNHPAGVAAADICPYESTGPKVRLLVSGGIASYGGSCSSGRQVTVLYVKSNDQSGDPHHVQPARPGRSSTFPRLWMTPRCRPSVASVGAFSLDESDTVRRKLNKASSETAGAVSLNQELERPILLCPRVTPITEI
jgi:hypothetical protein